MFFFSFHSQINKEKKIISELRDKTYIATFKFKLCEVGSKNIRNV